MQAKYLKAGQKFKFKGERVINTFIKDDGLEFHYKNYKGSFSSDYYNEEVTLAFYNSCFYLMSK